MLVKQFEADARAIAEQEAARRTDARLVRLVTDDGLVLSTQSNSQIIWP